MKKTTEKIASAQLKGSLKNYNWKAKQHCRAKLVETWKKTPRTSSLWFYIPLKVFVHVAFLFLLEFDIQNLQVNKESSSFNDWHNFFDKAQAVEIMHRSPKAERKNFQS